MNGDVDRMDVDGVFGENDEKDMYGEEDIKHGKDDHKIGKHKHSEKGEGSRKDRHGGKGEGNGKSGHNEEGGSGKNMDDNKGKARAKTPLGSSGSESESDEPGSRKRWSHKRRPIPRIEEVNDDSNGMGRRLRHKSSAVALRRMREPDLPMVTIPIQPRRQNQSFVETVIREAKNADTGVSVRLHKALPGSSPIDYEFRAWENTVSHPFIFEFT